MRGDIVKKIIISLAILLLMTGCSVNYDLEINDDFIHENINGNISKNEFDSELGENTDLNIYYSLYSDQNALIDSDELYNKNISEEDGKVFFTAKYDYHGNYKSSRVIDYCFEKHFVEETEKTYIIKLGGNFYCQYADEINVNVTTDNYVINNNADEVDGNIYKWKLAEGSKNNNSIEMIVSKDLKKNNANNNGSINYFQIVGTVIFVILLLAIFIIYKKHQNSEK